MPDAIAVRNPFLLMIQPEVILAAVEKSERLAQLNRRQCRPLDRITAPASSEEGANVLEDLVDADDEPEDH